MKDTKTLTGSMPLSIVAFPHLNNTRKAQNAFDLLRETVISQDTLAYYNPRKECKLWVDASNYGVGAILLQENSSGRRTHFQVYVDQLSKFIFGSRNNGSPGIER